MLSTATSQSVGTEQIFLRLVVNWSEADPRVGVVADLFARIRDISVAAITVAGVQDPFVHPVVADSELLPRVVKIRMESPLEVLLAIAGSGATVAGTITLIEWVFSVDVRIRLNRERLELELERTRQAREALVAEYARESRSGLPVQEPTGMDISHAEVFDPGVSDLSD